MGQHVIRSINLVWLPVASPAQVMAAQRRGEQYNLLTRSCCHVCSVRSVALIGAPLPAMLLRLPDTAAVVANVADTVFGECGQI